jgi:putative Mg2+ transporter-C (MgtC) family protein
MPLVPSWVDLCMRLLLTVAAGALIGINRQAGGHAAGFRTTVLVGLAACLSMIQANLLLTVSGKTGESFAVMDTLRLPLGILTGVGFIGGGAILKRGDIVTGVTTAATLWIMTAIGLCLGGGQLVLGCAGAVLAFVVLSPFKLLDERLPRRQKARLVIAAEAGGALPDVGALLQPLKCRARFLEKSRLSSDGPILVTYELKWAGSIMDAETHILDAIERRFRLHRFELLSSSA